jgi:hypothetical protein
MGARRAEPASASIAAATPSSDAPGARRPNPPLAPTRCPRWMQPAFPDDMVSMVLSPLGGPVRLEDPMVGAAGQVFQELLNDLSVGTTASGAIVETSMISR